jgi:hypothetical protein
MKRLNEVSFKVGDIILTTATAVVSKAIRAATHSDISHAMIYVEDHSVIDATGDGVHARNTQRLFFEDDSSVYGLRLREGLSVEQSRGICTFVRAQIGTQYSAKEAIRTAFGGARAWSRKQFCSRLVAQAYASVGINLVEDPNFCAPADIKDSPALIEVQATTVPVTEKEAARWEGQEDNLPQMMATATNTILDGMRTKNKEIQNFDDLNLHLAAHPEDDEYVCQLLETSGYLTIWSVNKEKNPWQYDLRLMAAFVTTGAQLEDYCRNVLLNELAGPNRYTSNRGGYAQLWKQFGLQSFGMMMELYEVLATLHRTRVSVATRWLQANGLFVPEAEPWLRPHTPEWFAALEVWDPIQAATTRAAIEAAGHSDVCSICGDISANDYRAEEGARPPSGVDTLRLCDDCLEIRREMGEPFRRLA